MNLSTFSRQERSSHFRSHFNFLKAKLNHFHPRSMQSDKIGKRGVSPNSEKCNSSLRARTEKNKTTRTLKSKETLYIFVLPLKRDICYECPRPNFPKNLKNSRKWNVENGKWVHASTVFGGPKVGNPTLDCQMYRSLAFEKSITVKLITITELPLTVPYKSVRRSKSIVVCSSLLIEISFTQDCKPNSDWHCFKEKEKSLYGALHTFQLSPKASVVRWAHKIAAISTAHWGILQNERVVSNSGGHLVSKGFMPR